MDVTGIAAMASELSQAKTESSAQLAVFKKALDIEAQGAMQLVQAAAQVSAAINNPPHLGNAVDLFI